MGEATTAARNTGTVCAVILTFNSLSRIQNCLPSVLAQTRLPEHILVVDNHSSDGTPQYLETLKKTTPALDVVRTGENLGPAGGFHLGMSMAFDRGFDYLWLLDDDSVPEPLCLESLLANIAGSNNVIAWPVNIDETGRHTDFTAWRGELIPREVVERGGLPNKELFWGVEDTEYFNRLQALNQSRNVKVQSALVHYTQSNKRKNAPWHYYYRARNMVYYRLFLQNPPRTRKLVIRLLRLWGRAMFKEEKKAKKTFYMIWGIWHGLRRRLGKTLDPT